jgi:predicted nucleic acid-binding protein
MIVLDASVLIAHLESTDRHHARATELLLSVADEQLAVSPLTLAEVLVGPARVEQLDRVQVALRALDIVVVPLADDAPARLAQFRANTRMRMPDCCVLLAAVTTASALATFDDQLSIAATALGLTVYSDAGHPT